MIKARYIGVDNELLQSGKVYKIKTISVMWNGSGFCRIKVRRGSNLSLYLILRYRSNY